MKTIILLSFLFIAFATCWDKGEEAICLRACYNTTTDSFPPGCCNCCEPGQFCAGDSIQPTCCKPEQAFCGCTSNRAFCEGSFFNSTQPVDSAFGTCYNPSQDAGVCCYFPSPNEWKVCPANTTCCGGTISGPNSITCCTNDQTCSLDSAGVPSCVAKQPNPANQTACLQACYNLTTDSFPQGCCNCCPNGSFCAGNIIEPTCCKNDQAFCGCLSNRAFCEGSFFNSTQPVTSPFGTCYNTTEDAGVCCYFPTPNEWKVCPSGTTCCGGMASGINSITCCKTSETCEFDSAGMPSCKASNTTGATTTASTTAGTVITGATTGTTAGTSATTASTTAGTTAGTVITGATTGTTAGTSATTASTTAGAPTGTTATTASTTAGPTTTASTTATSPTPPGTTGTVTGTTTATTAPTGTSATTATTAPTGTTASTTATTAPTGTTTATTAPTGTSATTATTTAGTSATTASTTATTTATGTTTATSATTASTTATPPSPGTTGTTGGASTTSDAETVTFSLAVVIWLLSTFFL